MTTTDLTSLTDSDLAAEIRKRHQALYDAIGEAEGRDMQIDLAQRKSAEIGSKRVTYFTSDRIERVTVEKL